MTAEEALAALKKARDTAEGWQRIAEILDQVRDSDVGGRRGKLSVSFIEEAAKASRYAPAVLRRMSAVRIFLEEFDRAHPNLKFRERLDGNTAQFSKLEMFARLHKVAPEKALEIADAVADGSLTQKALDLIYREASGRPLPSHLKGNPLGGRPTSRLRKPARVFPTPFHEACWEALARDVTKLSGEGDVRLSCDYRFTYFTPFAVAVGVKNFGIEFVDSFYPITLPTEPSQAQLIRELKEIVFQAPFFRRYWVLAPNEITAAQQLVEQLTLFGLGSIGFATLNEGAFLVQRPGAPGPATACRDMLSAETLKAGVPSSG